jgi:uncharacterized protein (TIGR03067 family)
MKSKPCTSLAGCIAVIFWLLPAQTARTADQPNLRQKLIATWVGGVVEGDGSRSNSTRARISELVITADRISAKDGQGVSLGEGTYTLGRSGNTFTIDASGTGGPTRNKQYAGILILDGDTLKWCSANPGRPRPTQFRSTPPDAFLMVLTRKK